MTQNSQLDRCLDPVKTEWFRCQLSTWADTNLREFAWRSTLDPYAVFIAEFMLQKTGATTVVPVYKAFMAQYPTLADLAAAPPAEVAKLLQPLGLYFRAPRLCQSVQVIVEKYAGKIPTTEAQLLTLPGIGKYTARAICASAYLQPLAVLDTNVARILERFFGLQGNRVKSRCKILWQAAEQLAPSKEVGRWNLTLLDFGAAICTAKHPSCKKCPLRQQCKYLISLEIAS